MKNKIFYQYTLIIFITLLFDLIKNLLIITIKILHYIISQDKHINYIFYVFIINK